MIRLGYVVPRSQVMLAGCDLGFVMTVWRCAGNASPLIEPCNVL
jgi:hypothetical protein